MDLILAFEAIILHADGRLPELVSLKTSPLAAFPVSVPEVLYRCGRVPHPELYMDCIAEGLGPRSWRIQAIEQLECMTAKFIAPYIAFYPIVSRDGSPFPVNTFIRAIKGKRFLDARAWRGDIVIAKFSDQEYTRIIDASMADFPIVKNWLGTQHAP
ncbi:uncharacterized protein B0H18DRAFT_871804 [Fomitopsis serialis]|uniref:uncharacterized protein n=1 Tax=Fomitopsis serialis TaxID=139415 RepID=UPI0020086D7A|nr:uncharacterized protein B0H18DRAFT_871804 [Neoantrodia serialis]KAH9931830.1 hypothetical protein B0H18DRAFT_871804 [Neoantrodia serialis]